MIDEFSKSIALSPQKAAQIDHEMLETPPTVIPEVPRTPK